MAMIILWARSHAWSAATSRQTVTTLPGRLERAGLPLHNRRHLFIKRLPAL